MNMEKSQARPYNILVVAVSAAEITFNTFDGFLTYCGYKATVCRGYAEATEILWNNYQAFNLTVVGINKPAKDTFDFIRKVKLVFSLPVIVVSTDCSQKSMFMAAESGCCAYFDPVKFGRVAKEFRNHLVSDNLKFNPLPPRHYAGAGTSDSGGEVVVLDDDCPSSSTSQQTKKRRVVWTDELHADFYEAVQFLGVSNAVPKKILLFMQRKHPHLSRENIASHLQKYREQRKPPYFSRKNDPSYLQNRERMNNMLKKKMQSGVGIETMVLRRNHFPNPSPLQIRNENENQNGYYPLPNQSPPQIEKEKEKGNQNGDYQQPNFAHEQFHLSFSQISFVQFPDPHLQVQHVQHDGNLGSNSRENEIAKKMNTKIYSGSLSV